MNDPPPQGDRTRLIRALTLHSTAPVTDRWRAPAVVSGRGARSRVWEDAGAGLRRYTAPTEHGLVPLLLFASVVEFPEIHAMVKLDMDEIRKLTVAERLALVEEIWDSISADPSSVPVSDAQVAEARRRLAEHDADPSSAVSWEDAQERLRSTK